MIVPATNAMAGHNQFLQREDDKQRAEALQSLMLARQSKQDDLAQALGNANIGHLKAQTNAATEGMWDRAEPFTMPDGTTIMAERHKQTGEYRPVQIGGGSPSSEAPGMPINTPKPASTSMVGVSDSQDMAGGGASAAPPAPTQAPTAAPTPTKQPLSGIVRPYVKPTNTRIDPLSPAGITADSLKAAKVAQAQEPYKKDPNAAPTPHFTPVTVTNPDGTVTVKPFNTQSGTTGESIGGPKPATGGGGQSLAPEDRAKMYNQAKIDNAEMKRIEGRVMRGELSFGTAAGLASAAQGAHGSPLAEGMSVLGNAAAGHLDPDIQKYITANSSYGRIMGNLQSKRYTDNQAQIEKTISGLKGNDLNNTIAYKQQLRDASLADPVLAAPVGGGQGGKAPVKGTHTTTVNGKNYVVPD